MFLLLGVLVFTALSYEMLPTPIIPFVFGKDIK